MAQEAAKSKVSGFLAPLKYDESTDTPETPALKASAFARYCALAAVGLMIFIGLIVLGLAANENKDDSSPSPPAASTSSSTTYTSGGGRRMAVSQDAYMYYTGNAQSH